MIEQAIAGRVAVSVAGSGDTTLTTANAATDQSRPAIQEWTGVVTGNANVICPTVSKLYVVFNNTTGAFTRTLKTAAGSGILVPQGKKMLLYCDGTSVVEQISAVGSLQTIAGAVVGTSLSVGTTLAAGASTLASVSVTGVATVQGALDESAGANIASAATTSIFATDGNYLTVTGVTGITSFGTAARAGARRKVKFIGVLNVTNGANLIVPGGSQTTQVGDVIEVVAETTTQHRIIDWMRADGSALTSGVGGFVPSSRTLTAGVGLSGGGDLSANRTFDMANTAVTPGAYVLTNITVDAQGRITAASNGSTATLVPNSRTLTAGTALTGGGDLSANRTFTLANTAVTPGSYTLAAITVDAQGRLTAAANGSNTGVTPASYTSTNLTVDAQGRITAASNGAAAPSAATQANQETGSSTTTYVSPGRQQFHPSAFKAWCRVTVSGGVPTLQANYNVASITDMAVGRFLVNFTTAFSSADYCWGVGAEQNQGVTVVFHGKDQTTAATASAFPVCFVNSAGSFVDIPEWTFWAIGDQ